MTYRLNVRCCCQPTKIFGTLEVESLEEVQQILIAPARAMMPSLLDINFSSDEILVPVHVPPSYATIKIKRYVDYRGEPFCEWAVYSDDRPIEFWRQFPQFREGEKTGD